MERRFFLKSLGVLGCSAAAHPWMTTLTLAQGTPAMGDKRLVVEILRGAMDGLDVVRPVGDRAFAAARPNLSGGVATDLDGFFALHDNLSGLMPLWQAGELGVVHATSTPYRDKRSHFDGQDLLEAGTGMDVAPGAARDGWLNRLLQAVPGITSETAYAVGREALPILGGPADMRNWAPDQDLVLSAAGRVLLDHVYHDDALFRDNVEEAFALSGSDPAAGGDGDMIVDFAAERLRGDTRIAAFSQSGWDTHKGQARGITKPLEQLQRTILRMKEQLGPEVWGKTVVMAMTEFGRTVRENGSAGTDHGTGGVMLVAGGAVKGDLMPTSDVRAWAAHAMRGLYGLDRGVLEASVFPGLDMGDDPGLLL